MKSNRSVTLMNSFGLAVLAVVLCSSLASAQRYAGKFTLPVETRWERAVLPAGEYSITLDTTLPRIFRIQRENKVVSLIPAFPSSGMAGGPVGGRSALIGIRNGQTLRIRALSLAELQMTLYFVLPKAESSLVAQGGPKLIERVPITMTGK